MASKTRPCNTQAPAQASGTDSTELAKLQAKAFAGDVEAQYDLACSYLDGNGAPRDDVEALRWFRAAADQSLAGAENNLGACLQNARGTQQDFEQAAVWYRKAAEQGFAIAQYNLACLLQAGDGVQQDQEEAARWFAAAAEQGHTEATCELGIMCRLGVGVPKDIVAAADLLAIAAQAGDIRAHGNLSDMRPEIEREALGGSQVAAFVLARMFESGLGYPKNKARAIAWYHWAIDRCKPQRDPSYGDEAAGALELLRLTATDRQRKNADRLLERLGEKAGIERNGPSGASRTTSADAGTPEKKPDAPTSEPHPYLRRVKPNEDGKGFRIVGGVCVPPQHRKPKDIQS